MGDTENNNETLTVSTVSEAMLKVYHLNKKDYPRDIPEGQRAFILNPYWIKYFGEGKWLQMHKDTLVPEEHPDFNVNVLRLRNSTLGFAGLINRGNTCYANSTVQSWFHNSLIRHPIMEMDFSQSPSELVKELQKLFYSLKYSKFQNVDPCAFNTAAGIDDSGQQDAHEFSLKLIDNLSEASPELKTLFQGLFEGTQAYVTKCDSCGSTSSRNEPFTYINIGATDTLEQGIGELFEAEVLDLTCDNCKATKTQRNIEYQAFPAVLQFNIVRYKFNSRTQTRTKITLSLSYPDKINMEPFLSAGDPDQNQKDKHEYWIHAAIMHYGAGVDSGHYVTKIRDHAKNTWHIFSDGSVLTKDSDEERMNASENVTMLIYIRKDLYKPWEESDCTLEPDSNEEPMKDLIETEDDKKIQHLKLVHKWKLRKHSVISAIAKTPQEGNTLDFHFLNTKWLREYLKNTDGPDGDYDILEPNPLDNNELMCPHGKVKPPGFNAKTVSYRVIGPATAELLYKELGNTGAGFPVREFVCEKCAKGKKGSQTRLETARRSKSPSPRVPSMTELARQAMAKLDALEREEMAQSFSVTLKHRCQSGGIDGSKVSKLEHSVNVESTMKMGELQSLIWVLFRIDVNKQSLTYGTRKLEDETKTVAEYGILPDAVISVDEDTAPPE